MSEAALKYAAWVAPSIDPADAAAEDVSAISAEEVAAVLEQAREEGYARGHSEGLRAGEQEIRAQVTRLAQLCRAMSEPLDQIDTQIQRRIAELTLILARRILRVELELHPESILPVVREAVEQLTPDGSVPRIRLHPDDAALLGELLARSGEGDEWRLVADERVARGGCRVHSTYTEVDATLESRLDEVTGQLRQLLDEELPR